MSAKQVFWLEELGREDHALVGRKCANLAEMMQLGLKVPQGFAVSLEAYIDFMNRTGAAGEIKECIRTSHSTGRDYRQFIELSSRIRQIVQAQEVPAEISEAVLGRYHELGLRCRASPLAVSVRSAGPVSRPGQYETSLNVSGDAAVMENLKKVWASTFNPRSLAFRSQKGLPLESDPIGIAVLKMVRAKAAGVVFTADPNTGEASRITIEANWGLGESVVGGTTAPDIYILEKGSLEIQDRILGTKSRSFVLVESGVAEVETAPGKAAAFCLSDEEVKAIATAAKKLEQHFGVAQDIEWALDEDAISSDNVVLLQARPEVIARTKSPVDQIVDLMLDRFSGGN
jgi:pyruvate,water dikinase